MKKNFFIYYVILPLIPLCGNELTWIEENKTLTVSYSGGTDQNGIGIPSWKIAIDGNNGGNFSRIYAPANNSRQLNDLTRTISPAFVPLAGTFTGSPRWDYFTGFTVPEFKIVENTPNGISLFISGTSPRKEYKYHREYRFSKEGVMLSGVFIPLTDLRQLHHWGAWNYDAVATPGDKLPVRSQGTTIWKYMAPASNDVSKPLPSGVTYPLQVEMVIRNYPKHYMHHFYDVAFDGVNDRLLYDSGDQNNKIYDVMGAWNGPNANDSQFFQIRIHFIDSSKTSSSFGVIKEINFRPLLNAKPNPFRLSTVLNFSPIFLGQNVTILNVFGQKVKSWKNLQKLHFRWNASNLPNGIYHVLVHSNKMHYKKSLFLLK